MNHDHDLGAADTHDSTRERQEDCTAIAAELPAVLDPAQVQPPDLGPGPFIEVDEMGKIVGITRMGLLIHEHNNQKWISGYTLEGYGIENLSTEERACVRM